MAIYSYFDIIFSKGNYNETLYIVIPYTNFGLEIS